MERAFGPEVRFFGPQVRFFGPQVRFFGPQVRFFGPQVRFFYKRYFVSSKVVWAAAVESLPTHRSKVPGSSTQVWVAALQ